MSGLTDVDRAGLEVIADHTDEVIEATNVPIIDLMGNVNRFRAIIDCRLRHPG